MNKERRITQKKPALSAAGCRTGFLCVAPPTGFEPALPPSDK